MAIQYKRILLKVSGEALSGPKGTGFDEETIASICAGIKAAHDLGAQIGIVRFTAASAATPAQSPAHRVFLLCSTLPMLSAANMKNAPRNPLTALPAAFAAQDAR